MKKIIILITMAGIIYSGLIIGIAGVKQITKIAKTQQAQLDSIR